MPNLEPVDRMLYTPTEAAQALSISRSTIYVLMASGDVPSVRIGSSRRIPVDGLRRYVNGAGRQRHSVGNAWLGERAAEPFGAEVTVTSLRYGQGSRRPPRSERGRPAVDSPGDEGLYFAARSCRDAHRESEVPE